MELLIDRLLADPARRGRTVRRLRLSARLAGGGGWRCERALRSASSSPRTARLALFGALDGLPGPADLLRLEATALGPPAADQLSLAAPEEERRRRLAEAVRQARAAVGADAVLRVLDVDPGSRLPERRAALTPVSRDMKRLYRPRPVTVRADGDGVPRQVDAKQVATVREEWLVEDGWWAEWALERRYFELVLEDGSDVVVFREPESGRWFRQRA